MEVPNGVETIFGIISFVLDKNQPKEELEEAIIEQLKRLMPTGMSLDDIAKNGCTEEVFETLFGNVLRWALENYI